MRNYKRIFLGGLFGALVSISLLVIINSSLFTSSRSVKKKVVSRFEIKKQKKKPKVLSKKKKIQKKKESLKPDLKNIISGMSFGIPAFELDFDSGGDFLKNGNYVNGDNVDQKPKVLYRPELEFPEKALNENISGHVTFGLFIDETGELEKIDVLESVPEGVFDKSAISNLKKWKFRAAVHKGVSVATWQEQKIVFGGDL